MVILKKGIGISYSTQYDAPFGYDHMTPEESAVMEAKQNEVLERLGITR